MSPPPDLRPPSTAAKPATPGGRPCLAFDFARKEPPRPIPPKPGSIREAIARWLDQPL